MSPPAEVKRAAQRAVNAAAGAALRPLGLVREGRSGRAWFDDRGWWRINVWFTASGFAVRVSLTSGIQHYWQRVDHPFVESALGAGPVDPYRTGALDGSVAPPEVVARSYAQEAARQVLELRETTGSDREHLDRCAHQGFPQTEADGASPPWRAERRLPSPVLSNVALGRLGLATELLDRQQRLLDADPGQHLHAELTDELADLRRVIDATDPRAHVEAWINQGRVALGLEPALDVLGFLDEP